MTKFVVSTLAFVVIVGTLLTLAGNKVGMAFKNSKIIPELIQVAPKDFLKVIYAEDSKVEAGNELQYYQVMDEPTVEWDADEEKFYTLMMLGLDIPTRKNPAFGHYIHWLVVNIPGANVTSGDVLAIYLTLRLPKDSGLHRTVFLLYQQEGKSTFNMTAITGHTYHGRLHFNVSGFAEKNAFGSPSAGNFFNCKWEAW